MISGFRVYIFPLICLCFFGCSLIPGELKTAEELMETSPDSALKVLRGIRRIQLINPADKALYALLMSQAYDKNDIKIESDSLISIAANYYDKKNPSVPDMHGCIPAGAPTTGATPRRRPMLC